jgi:hypothetical protein
MKIVHLGKMREKWFQ